MVEKSGSNKNLSERLPANPEVLKWARFYSRKMPLAEVVNEVNLKYFDVEYLKKIEAGEIEPTVSDLLKLKKIYKRPFSLFFLPEAPSKIVMGIDRRVVAGDYYNNYSEKLDLAYWRAYEIQDSISKLSLELGETIKDIELPPLEYKNNPDKLAEWAKEAMGIREVSIKKRVNPEDVLDSWIQKIEDFGVVVLQLTFDPKKDARAFSIGDKKPPVIVLNYKDKDRGRIFSLFHEFAHILLRQSSICDMHQNSSWREERFCNKFAASFLMPTKEIKNIINDHPDYNLDQIADFISRRTGASVEASFLRLVDLGYATQDGYLKRKPDYDAGYLTWLDKHKRGGPNPNPALTALNKCGKYLSDLVFRSFMNGIITRADASSITTLSARELPSLFKNTQT